MTRVNFSHCVAIVLACLALVLPAPAQAQESTSYAVLVGISDYSDDQIKDRVHAEDDVKAMYDVLAEKSRLGVPKDNMHLLLGKVDPNRPSKEATKKNIVSALESVVAKAKPNDLVYLMYIGQGAALPTAADLRVYFAADSTAKGRDKDALAATQIEEILNKLKSERFAAFVDVSFKGIKNPAKGTPEPSLGENPFQEFLGDDGTEQHGPLKGRVLFLATNGMTQSLDVTKHGIFADVVLKGLLGAADSSGYEADGVVIVDELAKYVNEKLPELVRLEGKDEEERRQMHFTLGTRGDHFVLVKNPAAWAKNEATRKKFEAMVKAGKVPEKFAKEGRELLARMPRLKAQQNLRKQYQALVDGSATLAAFENSRDDIIESTKIRRTEALQYARNVLEAVDSLEENYVKKLTKGEMVRWAIEGLFKRIDEKLPKELTDKLAKAKEMNDTDLLALLAQARQHLGKREDLDDQKDLNLSLQLMTSKLDPYTTYIDPETVAKFRTDIDSSFTGIGIQIRKDTATDQLLVVTPIKGSPALKAGVQTGDLIVKVMRKEDGKGKPLDPPETFETKGLPLSDAVKKILGQPGTKVILFLKREGVKDLIEVEITRGRVEVETVHGFQRPAGTDGWEFMIDKENKIGYIRLSSFARHSFRDMQEVMGKLNKQGIKGFVLDLRFNPGGLLDSAVNISDMYIDDGMIVSIRPRAGREAKFRGEHTGSMLGFPMVCMVNGSSASGSEIVSAALQDHGRAWIVGERSYGKGSVQNIQPFKGGALKLTTASFWRPNGKNLNKSSTDGKEEDTWGVTPDELIELSSKERRELAEAIRDAEIIYATGNGPDEKKEFEDRQLEAALKYLRGKIKTASRLNSTPKAG